jgi:hypothetical protein
LSSKNTFSDLGVLTEYLQSSTTGISVDRFP